MGKAITLEVLTAPGCHICRQFEEFWKTVERDWPNVESKKYDVTWKDFVKKPLEEFLSY